MPSQVLTEGARMLRFLTPTEPWRERVAGKVSLPGEWPVMLIEIFHKEDGKISMTCALGVPNSSLKAFLAQGLYRLSAAPPSFENVNSSALNEALGRNLANRGLSTAPIMGEKPGKMVLISGIFRQ